MQSVVVEICWRPASTGDAEVFHEVVDLDDGRVAVLVGHVSGTARAADVVDRLRGPLRRILREEPEPAVVLAKLDVLPEVAAESAVVACSCALVDPVHRGAWAAVAGDPPIVLVDGVGAEALESPEGPLGTTVVRRDVQRTMREDTAVFLWTAGLLGPLPDSPGAPDAPEPLEQRLADLLDTIRALSGASAWASEFARRAAARFGDPPGEAVVASIRLERAAATPALQLPLPEEPLWVTLQVHIDPADLRTRGLLRMLGRLTNLVRDVELHVELVDVTARPELAESVGILAAPTIVRSGPGQPVRVTGWFDSARAIGKALQLPLDTGLEDPETDGWTSCSARQS